MGTKVAQCEEGVLGSPDEKAGFKLLNSFDLEGSAAFFARKIVLVEGREDEIGIVAVGRHVGLFSEFPEEIGFTVVVTDSKGELPKHMKILNAFGIPYTVLHELDGEPDNTENQRIKSLLGSNRSVEVPNKVEDAVGHAGHFGDAYKAKKWFSDPANATPAFKEIVKKVFAG